MVLRLENILLALKAVVLQTERLNRAIKSCDVIVCDEIGPMELKSIEFINSAKNLLEIDKKIIVVVHQMLRHPLVEQFKNKSSFLINIDLENREKVNEILLHGLVAE